MSRSREERYPGARPRLTPAQVRCLRARARLGVRPVLLQRKYRIGPTAYYRYLRGWHKRRYE